MLTSAPEQRKAIKATKLHKIIVIFKGTEMVVCEEV